MIPYSRQFIDDDDIAEVIKVLKSEFITQGPKIEEFERSLCSYCGCRFAVVLNSGTSALHAAYFALGLQSGDEFITSPITFAATANAGLYLGAKPVFVDIEADTGNIDVTRIEEGINQATRLIVPIHYGGHPVDLQKISEIAKKHNLFVVEDACHALGAKYKGEEIGKCEFSDMAALSFHPVKHITTGEGGAVLTNNEEYYSKLLIFRTHGITKGDFVGKPDGDWFYEMQHLGYNYRMTDIQAALGTSQLRKLDRFVERRRRVVERYAREFKGNPYFDIPVERDYAFCSYHLYPIRLKDGYVTSKRVLFAELRQRGLGVQIHYIPVYLHPYYRELGFKEGTCSNAEDFYRRELSIPVYPAMSDEDAHFICDTMIDTFRDALDRKE